jgi:hypothetical protein
MERRERPRCTDEVWTRWRGTSAKAILLTERRCNMEVLETYTSVLTVLSAALLLVASGLAKKQLVWKRPRPVPLRRRRRSL